MNAKDKKAMTSSERENWLLTQPSSKGRIIPSNLYFPRPKAPSKRDIHRQQVALRRSALTPSKGQ